MSYQETLQTLSGDLLELAALINSPISATITRTIQAQIGETLVQRERALTNFEREQTKEKAEAEKNEKIDAERMRTLTTLLGLLGRGAIAKHSWGRNNTYIQGTNFNITLHYSQDRWRGEGIIKGAWVAVRGTRRRFPINKNGGFNVTKILAFIDSMAEAQKAKDEKRSTEQQRLDAFNAIVAPFKKYGDAYYDTNANFELADKSELKIFRAYDQPEGTLTVTRIVRVTEVMMDHEVHAMLAQTVGKPSNERSAMGD